MDLAVDAALGARVALHDAAVLEAEHVVALGLRTPIELIHPVSTKLSGSSSWLEAKASGAVVVAPVEDLLVGSATSP